MPRFILNSKSNKITLFILIYCVFNSNYSFAQLTANAGTQKFICKGASTTLGNSPTAMGGKPPYTYNWQPTTFLNNNTVSNPTAINCSEDVLYSLLITDSDGATAVAYTKIFVNMIYSFSAGIDTGYCFGQQGGVKLGALNNSNAFHTFKWTPASGLDNPNAANPIANPTITTIYNLQVSDGVCPSNNSNVSVTPFLPPIVNAGADVTIDEGKTITLNGTGGTLFWWQPYYNIKYQNTKDADVWPITTTYYVLYSENQHKCSASDTVLVSVTNGNVLFFYSAFTPNNDGDNDFFYIGNIEKYPDNNLKIFNRYGKLILSATNYVNTWDGKYLGDDVPAGTYYYILNDGKDKEYKGTITILR